MSKFIVVDTLSQYRMRYVIEVPDTHNDGDYPCTAEQWASDTVSAEEMQEFSQFYLGETILSTREIPKEEIIALCDQENTYCKSWADEHKMRTFVTLIDNPKDW